MKHVKLLFGCAVLCGMLTPPARGATTVTNVSAGHFHSLFITSDGSLWAMGRNAYGALGDGGMLPWPTIVKQPAAGEIVASKVPSGRVKAIAAGYDHSLFLKSDGSLWAMGDNSWGKSGFAGDNFSTEPLPVAASNVVAIAAGTVHSLFLKSDGSLWGMGNNGRWALGSAGDISRADRIPTLIVSGNVTAIAAGSTYSLFLTTDGSLWGMGDNLYGQLGDGTTRSNINLRELIVTGGVTAITAGEYHSLFLRSNGSLWAMGDNTYGQLGDGTTNLNSIIPEQIVAGNVTAIAAGVAHSLFLKSDGSLWAMGDNDRGELGDGTTIGHATPEQIVSSGVTAIAAGEYYSLFLKSDGSLWGMGANDFGQLGEGTTISHSTPEQIFPVVPRAQFTANPHIGPIPLTVQFTAPGIDTAGNVITKWNWNFGDGSTSADQNPMHTYTNSGFFSPGLIATNDHGISVQGSGPPITATTTAYSGLVVNGGFEAGNSFGWRSRGPGVDDGSISGIAPRSGYYEALLTTSGEFGFLTQTLPTAAGSNYLLSFWLNGGDGTTPNGILVSWAGNVLLDQTNLPVAGWTNLQFAVTADETNAVLQFRYLNDDGFFALDDIDVETFTNQFTAAPTGGPFPLTVQFTAPGVDAGGNTITGWGWNFGDGTTSSAQNPSHIYTTAGNYFPSLTTINNHGAAVTSPGLAIAVTPLPGTPLTVPFSATTTSGPAPLTVAFRSANSDSGGNAITGWLWNFGDGTTSSGGIHTYTHTGSFSPSLIATNIKNETVPGFGPPITVTVLPTVHFTTTPASGAIPLTVQFASGAVDSNGKTITNWSWNFGDGTISAAQSPSHTYTNQGSFSPSLKAINNDGVMVVGLSSSGLFPSVFPSLPALQIDANPAGGLSPLAVQFSSGNVDDGGNAVTNWNWDFGDGTAGTGQNPSHVYSNAGSFAPGLVAINNNGAAVTSHPASGPFLLIVTTNLTVGINPSKNRGVAPLTVQFTAGGGAAITHWNWNFGDGTTSSAQNPSHTYTNAGFFLFSLVATNTGGATVVGSTPNPSLQGISVLAQNQFTVNPLSGQVPLTVQFTAPAGIYYNSIGGLLEGFSYPQNWNFGDGSTSTAHNPTHVYTNAGTFFPGLTTTIAGIVTAVPRLPVTVGAYSGLVLNGRFETGDFFGWTRGGNFIPSLVTANFTSAHSGTYGADLGSGGSPGFLYQTLDTTAGTAYMLSFWLDSPDGATPNEFSLSWDGKTILAETNLGTTGWTNMQFLVSATGTKTALRFGFQNDSSNFGLDDISVVPAPRPGIAGITLSGRDLVVNGTNGLSGGTYFVLASTNLMLPLSRWTPVSTNVLSADGSFTIISTNTVNPSVPHQFYVLQLQ